MRPSQALSISRVPAFGQNSGRRFFRRALQRRVVCCAVALNLLLWPGPGLVTQHFIALASEVLNTQIGSHSYEAFFLGRLFSQSTGRPRRETMADRASAVAHIQINPGKLVGYQDEGTTFMAAPSDYLDRTVQGVKFTWESSNTNKLQIDEAGRARFLEPGLARVTCRAGTIEATAHVLIRPNHRPRQSDAEWRNDQATLRADGSLIGEGPQSNDDGSQGSVASLVSSLLDKLAPTASAQGYPDTWADDLGYDQLWNEPRNLVGSPRNAAAAPMPLGSVLPEGSNFNWESPIISLGGRGLSANLMLRHNSRVWSRRNNQVAFDAITGWPAPGFSLGFGRIVLYDFSGAYGVNCKYMLVDPDGTRHYLGSGSWAGIGHALGGPFETSDGSHIVYTGNGRDGGYLHYPDGTTVMYTAVNNRLLPTMILDRNANYIQIAYKPDCFVVGDTMYCGYFAPMAIDYVIDTLGRRIEFQYDSNYRLSGITRPGFGGTTQNPVTDTLVQFDYQTVTPVYSFSGLTVERAAPSLRLKHIYFPATGTGYLPTYTQYAVISSVSVRRQMSIGWPNVIQDGVQSAAVSFNYPASGSLTDCPAFTQRTDTAVNSPTRVYGYSTSTDTIAQTMTFTVTQPDSTTVLLTRSTNGSSPANGRLVQTEVKNGAVSLAKTVLSYVNDGGGSPQVESVTSYDDNNAPVKLDFDYDAKGNITNRREYGYQVSGAWQVRRRTRTTYTSIAGADNLVTEVDVYDALLNTNDADDVMIAKTTYAYDNYVAMGGLEDYGGTANPPGHMLGWPPRGNVTGVTQWTDLGAGTTIQHLAKYDIFGNVVKAQVSCCQEKDLTNTEDTYWSQTDTESSGDPNGVHQTTSTDYDFNTSLPWSATDTGGLTTTIGYDAALNPTYASLPTGASANAGYDYWNLSSYSSVTYTEDTDWLGNPITKTLTTSQAYDGWGRVIRSIDRNNGQVNTSYDSMGRVVSRTNPFTAGGTPGPATTIQYDLANKAVITTLPGGNTVRSDYSGATVTATDQVNRKIKRESDGLGRLTKVTEQDSSGVLAQETTYSYSLIDKLTLVNQGNQTRSYKYDALGRLLYEKIPEQSSTINDGTGNYWSSKYTYTEFSAVSTSQDPRGVVSTYSYDALHRTTGITYNTVSGVTTAPEVTYIYDYDVNYGTSAPGKLVRVNVWHDYQERYTFDSNFRVSSAIRTIGSRTYSTSYNNYNGASQLKQMTYPSTRQLNFTYDSIGRPSALAGYLSNIGYNIAGQVISDSLLTNGGSYVNETFGYDTNRMQLTTQTATKAGNTLMNLTYNYQATAGQMGSGSTAGNAGQLMSISGTINGTTESAAYTYDNLGRLVTSNQSSNGSSAQRRFTYDRWGNRGAVYDAISGGTLIQNVALEQSGGAPTNRISALSTVGWYGTYTYDAAGNVTWDGVHSYGYDSENRIVSVDGGSTASYAYDHQNRRYKKTIGSTVTHYVWQGSKVLAEHNGSTGAVLVDYVYSGSRMIAKVASGTTSYFLNDRLSTRLTLNTSGAVVGRQAHLPFGEDFGESGTQQKHHFTSYERDGESGTDYAVNRQYSQSTGRFNRPDPKQSSARLDGPQSWNRYSYVANEPLDQTDPLGLEPPVGGENNPFENSNCNPAYGDCPAWIHDCQSYGASCSFTSGVGLISGGEGGGSPVRVPQPRPGPSCIVLLNFRLVEDSTGRALGLHHGFLLVRSTTVPLNMYYGAQPVRGILHGISGVYDSRIGGDFSNVTPADDFTQLRADVPRDCATILSFFDEVVTLLNSAHVEWRPLGPNSNSFVYTLLLRAGLLSYFPDGRLRRALGAPSLTLSIPGWGVKLPIDG